MLTNADEGVLLHREIVEWALEAYCGAVEPEPEPITVSDAELAALSGRYNSPLAYVDVRPEGEGLVLTIAYTEAGERMLLDVVGEVPETKPYPVRLISGDRFMVTDGEAKGMKGHILREDGAVRAMNVGGRLVYRVD